MPCPLIPASIALSLAGCIYSDGNAPPPLTLRLHFPETALPPFESASRSNRTEDYARRCIVEAYRSGEDMLIFRRNLIPVRDDDGGYTVTIDADEGLYDLMIWCDYTSPENPNGDFSYVTDNLHRVTVVPDTYTGDMSSKDAACAFVSQVSQRCDINTDVDVALQRPLAGYRVISDDVAAYRRMSLAQPDRYPPLEELTVDVAYEFFVPSSFNIRANRPNDSATGISYRFTPRPASGFPSEEAVMIAGDMVFAFDTDSSVSLTIEVRDRKGNIISRASGVRITDRRGYETTVTGSFLTLGVAAGGIAIDPAWREDIVIRF